MFDARAARGRGCQPLCVIELLPLGKDNHRKIGKQKIVFSLANPGCRLVDFSQGPFTQNRSHAQEDLRECLHYSHFGGIKFDKLLT